MQKILLVTTGGTIASKLEQFNGYSPSGESLKEYLNTSVDILDSIELIHWDFSNILSFAFTPGMVIKLLEGIIDYVKNQKVSGVIVVSGTAMLEEVPYFADLFWNLDTPIVFTGAMRNRSQRDHDGPQNIRNSLIVTLEKNAIGKGVLVCLGGEIYAAKDVYKTHKTSLTPLSAYNTGPLGAVINENQAVFYHSPLNRCTFNKLLYEPLVEIVKVSLGSNGLLIDTLIQQKYKGIVIEALPGGGGVTPDVYDAIKRGKEKAIFVMCPRSIGGSAVSMASGGCGPVDLRKIGVPACGDLASVKAKLFLMAALPNVRNVQEIRDILQKFYP